MAAGSGSAETPVRLDAIGIPTAGNEARLRRVITTFAHNAREHGRPVTITVSSNSPPGRAADTAALIESLAKAESFGITLLDDEERLRMGDTLAQKAGVDPAIARFALSDPHGAGFACGANRNALLLRNAGRPYLSLDDDMACEMSTSAGL